MNSLNSFLPFRPDRLRALTALLAALLFTASAPALIGPSLQRQLGNPTTATADPGNHTNFLMERPQFALDYNDTTRDPNWVAWNLTASDHGTVPRSDFIPDPDLPAGFYAVTTSDYNGVGDIDFNRGHMCPSADRNDTVANNQVAFYMTNIVPQSADNNQGPWALFESDCRALASAGNEILLISGPSLFGGAKIPSGIADISNYVWKIAVVVPLGPGSALSRITADTRVIALKMPNINGIRSNPWTDYVVSASEIEADTGYTFFTNLPAPIAAALRVKVDGGAPSGGIPTITAQPVSQTVLLGGNVTFSVGASGGALSYQWRKDDDDLAGATNPTLTLTGVVAGDAAGYDVVVSNANGAVTSSVAILTISAPTAPVITTQPASQTVTAGGTAAFSVVATGLPAPTFQWYQNDTILIPGATGATLLLPNVQAADSGSTYRVVVSNSAGTVTSDAASLTVTSTPPTVTTQPASQTVALGSNATFSVVASGSAPLSYQWRKNGTPIPGATDASLAIGNVQSADGGSYDVVVTNFGGAATSNLAVLSLATTTPTNATQVLYAGGTYSQDFDSLPSAGTFPLTGPGPFYLSNPSPGSPPGVNAINLGGWSVAKVTAGGALSTGNVLFNVGTGSANTGSAYSFGAASSPERALGALLSGSITCTWGVTLVNNTGQPINQFTITYAGEQWRYGGGTNGTTDRIFVEYRIGGTDIATGAFTATPATLDFSSIINSSGGVQSTSSGNGNTNRAVRTATITGITWPAGANLVLRWRDFDVGGSDDGLAIDDFSFTTPVPSAVPPTVAIASTSPAANAANVPVAVPITVTFNRPVTVAGGWFNITSATHGPVAATVSPASGASATFTLTPAADFAHSDTINVTLAALQIADAASGTHPTSDYAFSFGTVAPTAPSVVSAPRSQAVVVGGTVNFNVAATGTAPLTYQWRKDGVALNDGGIVAGATTPELTLTGVSLADAGDYDVVVNNVTNVPATSSAATLLVSTTPIAPTIETPPQSQAVSFGGTATFTVAANGTTPFTYQWRKDGNSLVNGSGIAGATSDTLVLAGVTFLSAGSYDVVVSNGTSPDATSAPATLTVNSASGASVVYFTGGTYAQNFNSLPSSGTYSFASNGPFALDAPVANSGVGAAGLTGWSFAKYAGSGGSAIFRVDTGSSNSGGATSYGSSATTDRALGSLGSGGVVSRFGLVLVNQTGQTITAFTLGYAGEQWRHGGATTPNTLAFSYAVGATDINTGTFASAPALDFTAPIVTTSSGALNGNATANRVVIGGQVTGVNWGPGQVLVLRWSDVDDGGADDGLAVDDLTFALAAPAAPVIATQPPSQTVTVGGGVSFTVAATGTPAPVYQWRKGGVTLANGGSVSGATSPTLTLANVTTANAGSYDVLVTNGIAPAAVSDAATLTVNKAAATVTLDGLSATYNGSAKSATATTSPANLAVAFTYDGSPDAPVNAGSYAVVATIDDANYEGSASGTLVIAPAASIVTWNAPAAIVYGTPLGAAQLNATADTPGAFAYAPAAGTVLGAGANQTLGVTFTPADPTNFTHTVASTTITVDVAPATIVLDGLAQSYDGQPKPVTAITVPAGLTVNITYDGSATAPTIPGQYAVVATIADPNYRGSVSGTLVIGVTALVRHAPTLNGDIDGSLQVLLGENLTLNGGAMVSGDILVPGTPTVRLNGHPTFVGTREGTGSESPSNYQVTLNGNAVLRYLVRRTDALPMPTVSAPPAPVGIRNVTINSASQSAGDFATLRNLTLNGNAGQRAIPAGTYGSFTANGNSGFVLGVAGATEPSVYHLQGLTLNGNSRLQVVGPVIVHLASGVALNGSAGNAVHPEWLTLKVAAGGVTLNGNVAFHGHVNAPSGTVTINGSAVLRGGVIADRLTINGSGGLVEP